MNNKTPQMKKDINLKSQEYKDCFIQHLVDCGLTHEIAVEEYYSWVEDKHEYQDEPIIGNPDQDAEKCFWEVTKSMMRCDDCKEWSEDAEVTICPYAEELYNKKNVCTLCKECFNERLRDI